MKINLFLSSCAVALGLSVISMSSLAAEHKLNFQPTGKVINMTSKDISLNYLSGSIPSVEWRFDMPNVVPAGYALAYEAAYVGVDGHYADFDIIRVAFDFTNATGQHTCFFNFKYVDADASMTLSVVPGPNSQYCHVKGKNLVIG